ncbi:lactate utilization protein C [Mammaliicoccus sp. Dog046]|uniref:LutC/YkgG family protein n=1 Tax=Mammaliicoccus sp. Dog046 TaxID=3034233 RepID=UPI002B25B0BB|nr:lactate utilization protein C [Mammaliicoccus sp. Dog046]WQK86046.1 lactate utilization protein C [Mammaliicoccus sp. Dog046]
MAGKIQNRTTFLNNISEQLGRPKPIKVNKPEWSHRPQDETLTDLNQTQLVELLEEQCKKIHTGFVQTKREQLDETLTQVIDQYGNGEVIAWNDSRFEENKINLERHNTYIWDESKGEENRIIAERANIGITFSDTTLAESGTVVLYAGKGKGRSVSLLPTHYIAIIPKSTIVPRYTQAAQEMNKMMDSEERFPSCINLISGPSNSADIEMELVVGVHGPVKATYIIVEDI